MRAQVFQTKGIRSDHVPVGTPWVGSAGLGSIGFTKRFHWACASNSLLPVQVFHEEITRVASQQPHLEHGVYVALAHADLDEYNRHSILQQHVTEFARKCLGVNERDRRSNGARRIDQK